MKQDLSRRDFVTSAAAAVSAAPAVLSAQTSPNNRVRVGWIATGSRGKHVMNQMYLKSKDLVDVVAVCDAYQGNLNAGADIVASQEKKPAPKKYVDYRELINDPNVDVVFICSPEHLHHAMAMAALKANKNIYLEKPIGHTVEEGADIVRAAEKSGKVVQVGTQNRSNKLYIQAKKMFDDGLIGDVHYVRAFWYRNFDPNVDPITGTQWHGAIRSRRTQTRKYRLEAIPRNRRAQEYSVQQRNATSSGAIIGTTPAASRPTCSCTRPISVTSS